MEKQNTKNYLFDYLISVENVNIIWHKKYFNIQYLSQIKIMKLHHIFQLKHIFRFSKIKFLHFDDWHYKIIIISEYLQNGIISSIQKSIKLK